MLGSSGFSTGPHLHFELTETVQKSGTYFKPTASIDSNDSSIGYIGGPSAGGSSSGGSTSGGSSSGGQTPAIKVTFSTPTDSKYASKASIGYDNATVVTKVTKTSGAKVTGSGLNLYDASGKLIKQYQESVSNVSNSQTTYHIWWDIKNEVGVTLQQGTT